MSIRPFPLPCSGLSRWEGGSSLDGVSPLFGLAYATMPSSESERARRFVLLYIDFQPRLPHLRRHSSPSLLHPRLLRNPEGTRRAALPAGHLFRAFAVEIVVSSAFSFPFSSPSVVGTRARQREAPTVKVEVSVLDFLDLESA